jgi:signal transduction histidine kinase
MKKILSSLFMKYMLTFIGIMVLSNVISTIIVFVFFDVDVRFAALMAQSKNAPPKTNFIFAFGSVTIFISAVCIFFAVKSLVKPIKKISTASKIVAEGNFDIHINVSGGDEVAELAKNFNTMTVALSKNEYLHKDFVSNVSHEFKTPLTSLRGYAKLLKKQDLSEEKRQECLDIIIAETERLSTLSSNLLRLSELDHEVIISQKECFSVDEQIRDVIVLLQNEWEKKNIEIDLEMDTVQFAGDKSLMYQVWVNLIGNALKYSSQNGLLQVRLFHNERIIIKITDNGIGMTKEEQERVFERFYKADISRNSVGTGLGLPISKKIVELHGGTIVVQSEVGKGSTFIISF